MVRLNRELTSMQEEVLENLESIHGALLRMNRSIQAEDVFGIINWDRRYKRAFRRGLDSVILESTLFPLFSGVLCTIFIPRQISLFILRRNVTDYL